MLKTYLRKIKSFLNHLVKGTAGQRVRFLFRKWRSDNFWLGYPGWGNSFVFTLPEGVRIRLHRDDRLSELIYKQGFEENERAFVCDYLKQGMIFLDVGANIGLYSLIAAKMVGLNGLVYSLEPASRTYQRLLQNIQLNQFRQIEPCRVALSNKDETHDLTTYPRMYSAWNSLGGQIVDDQMVRKERVECIRLNRFIKEANPPGPISLMKIDVEGWEWYVLKGGESIFQLPNAPDMLIEFSDSNMETTGISAAEVYDLLQLHNYEFYRIDSAGKRLLSEPFGENHPYENYFLTKNLARVLELTNYHLETL